MPSILEVINEIALEGGTNDKMKILKSHKETPFLKEVLYAAKSPRKKYHIRKIPAHTPAVSIKYTIQDILKELDKFSSRELTGNAASAHLKAMLEGSSEDDGLVLIKIIEKDLKMGMGKTNINKIYKDLLEKTPYQGAKAFSEKGARDILKEGMAYSDLKADGRYANAIIEDGHVYLESRAGETTLLTGAKILTELSQFDDCVLNGELTIPGIDRLVANGIITSIISTATKISEGEEVDLNKIKERHGLTYEEALERIVYSTWDMITLEEYDAKKSDTPYNLRRAALIEQVMENDCERVDLVEHKIVTTYKEAMDHFVEMLDRGLEGTILKSFNAPWKDGKPKWQVKMKLEMDIDMKIVGFNYGSEGTKNENVISSLTVESSDGKVRTKPAGIKEADMEFITENQDSLLGTIVEMKCNGLSHDSNGNLSTFHPTFKSFRDDKSEANSHTEIVEIERMSKELS